MKSIVVVSDTHGNFSALEKLLPIMKESDYVFCLNDYQRDILAYKRELGDKIYSVSGNCDGGGGELILEIEGNKILLTHGHEYNVKSSLYRLVLRAKELGVNTVFYGHTHQSDIVCEDGITFINPGCATRFGESSYCYAVIYNGKITVTIVPIR